MSYYSDFKEHFDAGQKGEHKWVPLSQSKLNSNVVVGKSMYYLFGGIPGSGKTAFVDDVFVLDIYENWRSNKFKSTVNPYWIYRSMERARYLKIAKWICARLYKVHGILMDVPTIMNYANKERDVTIKERELIASCEDYFEEMEERVHIFSGSATPQEVWKDANDFMQDKGKITYRKINMGKTEKTIVDRFVYSNPADMIFHITDHIGKVKKPKGMNPKETLDLHSENMGELRDLYSMFIIDISQFNREVYDTMRNLKTDIDVMPNDFKGTGDVYENADVVIGLMNPFKLNSFQHMNYNISAFVDKFGKNRFRSLKIIKNSYGVDKIKLSVCHLTQGKSLELLVPSYIRNNIMAEVITQVW